MSDNLKLWKEFCRPPAEALKAIGAGRMKGKSDINPQWRYEAMTSVFGACGFGWKFEIESTWLEDKCPGGQVVQMAKILLFVKDKDKWSEPIPGAGGSMLVVQESKGLHINDEAVKMAVTDALGTAMKMLGVAADIYKGLWDGHYYKDEPKPESDKQKKYRDFEFLEHAKRAKEVLGEQAYYEVLGLAGYEKSNEIPPDKREEVLAKWREKVKK